MTDEELRQLMAPEVQAMLERHRDDDPAAFALRLHARRDLPVRAMAEQLACRRKARRKLPSLVEQGLLFTTRSLAQASGERAARWRASQLSGRRLLDLTGGLGIDDLFLSERFEQVVSVERDPVLSTIARHNARACGRTNIEHHCADALELLASFPDGHFDWIYVDPDRREGGRRRIGLEASSPDVVAAHALMLRKARRVCIKASPMLEPAGLGGLLPSLAGWTALSVEGQCKELLVVLEERGAAGGGPMRRAVSLGSSGEPFVLSGAEGVGRRVAEGVGRWLFEPDAAVIKAGLSEELAQLFGLEFVNRSVDYLTGELPPGRADGFPGRVLEVVEALAFKPKRFKGFLKEHAITHASLQRRDFPLSSDELRRRYRLGESPEHFLFFTRDRNGGLLCIYALNRSPAGGAAPSGPGRSAAPGC